MIRVENLTKSYRTEGGRHYVFRDINALFPENANIGIIGPNGGGKSTFLRLLGGIDHPDRGRIISNKSFSWPLGLKGGFVSHLTGRENCRMVCNLYGLSPRIISRKLENIKELSGIGKYFEEPVDYYSSGMGGRLGFAMSMAFDFDYFLIDEITSVGDAHFKALAKKTLEEKAKKCRVIMVSHNMGDLKKFCDVAVLISDGQFRVFHNLDEAIRAYLPQTQESANANAAIFHQAAIEQLNLDSVKLPASVSDHMADVVENLKSIEDKLTRIDHPLVANEGTFFQSLAQAYDQLGNRAKAIAYFEKALAANPYQLPSLLKLADYALQDGLHDRCSELISTAEACDPKNTRVLSHRIRQKLREANLESALEFSDLSLTVAPENADVWHLRAQVFARQKRYDDALSAQSRAITLAPKKPSLQTYLSSLLAHVGEIQMAQLAAQKARLLQVAAEPPSAPDLGKLSQSLLKLNHSLKA